MALTNIRPDPTPTLGWARRRSTMSFGTLFTITAAGAIASQDKSEFSGMGQVVKTATKTGRYTFSLPVNFKNLRGGMVTIIGPDDANYGANTTGLGYFWRDNDLDFNATSLKDGTIELQFYQTSYADAEVPSGVQILVEIIAEIGV